MATSGFRLPLPYRLFFLTIEPISALVGAYFAYCQPFTYLQLTHKTTAPLTMETIPQSTTIILNQLANLYLFFALNEALVLRSTGDIKVWKRVLLVLLIADFGHLYSVKELGSGIYWEMAKWNAIDWGNVAFVYMGASMRIAFLSGVGLKSGRRPQDLRTTKS